MPTVHHPDSLAGVAAFLSVARRASFTAAADDLGIGRATVGAQVRALEKRLGVQLLQRSTRTVRLTEAGAAYLDALAGLPEQLREAERTAVAFQTEAIGRLRVSAPPDLGPQHLAPVLAAYLAAHPGLSVDLRLSNEAADLVGGGYDLAIRGALAVEPHLVTRRIGCSPIVACASPAYLARCGAPRSPHDLRSHACLHFSELRWGRAWQFRRDGAAVDVPIAPRLECDNGPTLLAMAVAGAGIALEPAFVVGPALRDGALRPVLTDWQLPSIPIHAVYPAHRHIARKVRAFVDLLADAFARHPDLAG